MENILTTPLAIDFLVLQCAALQQLLLDATSGPTTPRGQRVLLFLANITKHNTLTNKAHVCRYRIVELLVQPTEVNQKQV
jgi:hypothetical protein